MEEIEKDFRYDEMLKLVKGYFNNKPECCIAIDDVLKNNSNYIKYINFKILDKSNDIYIKIRMSQLL